MNDDGYFDPICKTCRYIDDYCICEDSKMTPAERLKEIEKILLNDPGVNYTEIVSLLYRVKKLTEALENISMTETLLPNKDLHHQVMAQIARKALEEE